MSGQRALNKATKLTGPTGPGRVKVAVVSDRPPVWSEIASCLTVVSGAQVVRLFSSRATKNELEAVRAGVVILDCGAGETGGLSLVRRLVEAAPTVRAVVVVDSIGASLVFEAMSAGACAVLKRPLRSEELARAVLTAAGGGFYLGREAAALLVGRSRQLASGGCCPADLRLTAREEEVLRLQAQGLPYKEIAARLQVSEHTVNNHLYSIRQKLGVHNAVEAISAAFWRETPPHA